MSEWTLRIMAIAEKRISRIPNAEKKRILMAIDELRYDPFAHDVISLSGRREHRLRVGGWRVLLLIDENDRSVTVLSVNARGDAYKK